MSVTTKLATETERRFTVNPEEFKPYIANSVEALKVFNRWKSKHHKNDNIQIKGITHSHASVIFYQVSGANKQFVYPTENKQVAIDHFWNWKRTYYNEDVANIIRVKSRKFYIIRYVLRRTERRFLA